MKISDLRIDQIVVGMKVMSLKTQGHIGQIVKIDAADDNYAWILWPGQDKPTSGFYGNDCECEIVNE